MPRRRLPHVQREVDRHGNVRWYFRRARGGKRHRLPDDYGSPAFVEAYHAALAERPVAALRATPGTLEWLVMRYKASAVWSALEPSTRAVRDRLLARLVARAGKAPVAGITRAHVQAGLDERRDKPEAANAFLKTMRQLLDYGIQIDAVRENVAKNVKALKSTRGGHPPWTVAEIEAYEARHPVGTKARLAFDLLLYTGLRKADVVLIGRRHLVDDVLQIVPHKTRKRTGVTVHQRVAAELLTSIAATTVTGTETFIVTDYGRPFTANGFGNWFRERCDEAGVSKSAHGLRKAGAMRAAENGATVHELMALFGWVNLKEAELYTREADRKRLALAASKKMLR